MTTTHCLKVDLSSTAITPSYDIIIGDGVLGSMGECIAQRLGTRRTVIVTDRHVNELYAKPCAQSLENGGHKVLATVVIPSGEGHKNFQTLEHILNEMLAAGADRKTLIVALGGGVVGDIAGLAAGLFMRGIDVVQVPTTLLAQVDSSVGGKTAIDTKYGKNTVGLFCQPRMVLIDVALLASLPQRELRAGYAEIVKYGLIDDPQFFEWCLNNGAALLQGNRALQVEAIQYCCASKARIVSADEKESGSRALLNFGHTFGHALETVAGYHSGELLHGEAVAVGLVLAHHFSVAKGFCPSCDAEIVSKHLQSVGLPVKPSPKAFSDINQLVSLMAGDKKADQGRITLILTRGIGKAYVEKNVSHQAVAEFLDSQAKVIS